MNYMKKLAAIYSKQFHTTLPSIEDELDPIPKEWSTSDEAGNSIGTSKTMGTFLVQLLSVLVQWVPHSVNDDTFHCL